jgi:hypothetical protein
MSEALGEEFALDLEPSHKYLRHDVHARIQHERAKTANLVAVMLVAGVVLSLPVFLLSAWTKPDQIELTKGIFDKWYSIVSPLAGTAIGAYYGSRFAGGGKRTTK